MIHQLLEDVKHMVFAVRSTLGRNDAAEYIKLEESESVLVRPHHITDKQAMDAVKASLSDLVTVMRQRIKARK
jgi:hypothetical protein